MCMYGGPLGNIQHLYLYGRVTRLYEMCILKIRKFLALIKV